MTVRLTIGEFSKMTYLSVKALRHYHEVGLLTRPHGAASTRSRTIGSRDRDLRPYGPRDARGTMRESFERGATMTDVESRGAFAALGKAMRDIREAEAQLRAEQDEVWRRYVERVDTILAMDLRLEAVRDDDDHDPSHLLDALRARVGELRVQARLGAMEGEELVGRVRAALRRLAS